MYGFVSPYLSCPSELEASRKAEISLAAVGCLCMTCRPRLQFMRKSSVESRESCWKMSVLRAGDSQTSEMTPLEPVNQTTHHLPVDSIQSVAPVKQ